MRATIKNSILTVHFNGDKTKMNQVLDCISNKYEGPIRNREGHNFPATCIPKQHILYQYAHQCKYVIAVYNNKSIQHELLHARYYTDQTYQLQIQREWAALPPKTREHLILFLKRLGYPDHVLIDEYQAYRYTEAPNFFGLRLE